MTATFYAIPTDVGNAKDANAKALGLPRKYVALAVGDGGGDNAPVPTPKPSQKALLGEWRRAALNTLETDPKNPAQLIAEQVIPETVGGKWIRELGLYDEDGDLCYVSNAPPTYKPALAEGSGKTQSVRMVLINASGVNVDLKIDPSLILATREYADKSVTAAMKAHLDAEDPHPQYATKTLVSMAFAGHVKDADPHPQYAPLAKTPLVYSITALPAKNVGPIVVAECGEVWIWSESDYFKGYRSPLCGRPVDGHTLIPLASEIDAVGGLASKSDYARLWGYAKENNLVVPQATWDSTRGAHFFVDYSGTQFRLPDLRNMFRRFTGTDADTANARTLGSRQSDQFRSHSHGGTPSSPTGLTGGGTSFVGASGETSLTGGTETRPVNTAYAPRIHV